MEQGPTLEQDAAARQIRERLRRELPRLSNAWADELALAIRRLVTAFQPERVYLFGSHARGTAGPDSDIDLLVVVPASDQPTYQLEQQAYAALGWHSVPIEVLVMTQVEFTRRLAAVASLPATVEREGRLLYAA